ncbi:IS30 family transposase [Jiella avicenniae]|uniref:IS30 family transposase n=1 Tax=Jiella avicenniae TaxID=2907202 RepID=A0A9X1P3V6_9HYPH|nr:IS30 family transposase [Jiella avicenniae]MCE7029851.1 IS30 family transposase [Jiella avicenniae]
MAATFAAMLNLAMRIERERHLGARAYERAPEWTGYANGTRPKTIDTPAGRLSLKLPKSRGGNLVRRRRTWRPMKARTSRDTIKDRRSIHDRPAEIEDRRQAGHWEADLVICRKARPVLVLHERKTRVTLATRLTGKTAAETIAAMTAVFRHLAPGLRSLITFDNNTAFARQGLLGDLFSMTTWFCDACASWQKGGVENANGRLRRWILRSLDLDIISDADLQDAVITLNTTPRKCLGFVTPL